MRLSGLFLVAASTIVLSSASHVVRGQAARNVEAAHEAIGAREAAPEPTPPNWKRVAEPAPTPPNWKREAEAKPPNWRREAEATPPNWKREAEADPAPTPPNWKRMEKKRGPPTL